MTKFSTVTCISEKYTQQIKSYLCENGYKIYEITGNEIIDEKTFFKEAARSLPQDPPLSGNVNYDAFIDSISGGIFDIEKENVAFLWSDTNNILKNGLQDLLKIVHYFYYVQERLKRYNYNLLVFLLGSGVNFQDIEMDK